MSFQSGGTTPLSGTPMRAAYARPPEPYSFVSTLRAATSPAMHTPRQVTPGRRTGGSARSAASETTSPFAGSRSVRFASPPRRTASPHHAHSLPADGLPSYMSPTCSRRSAFHARHDEPIVTVDRVAFAQMQRTVDRLTRLMRHVHDEQRAAAAAAASTTPFSPELSWTAESAPPEAHLACSLIQGAWRGFACRRTVRAQRPNLVRDRRLRDVERRLALEERRGRTQAQALRVLWEEVKHLRLATATLQQQALNQAMGGVHAKQPLFDAPQAGPGVLLATLSERELADLMRVQLTHAMQEDIPASTNTTTTTTTTTAAMTGSEPVAAAPAPAVTSTTPPPHTPRSSSHIQSDPDPLPTPRRSNRGSHSSPSAAELRRLLRREREHMLASQQRLADDLRRIDMLLPGLDTRANSAATSAAPSAAPSRRPSNFAALAPDHSRTPSEVERAFAAHEPLFQHDPQEEAHARAVFDTIDNGPIAWSAVRTKAPTGGDANLEDTQPPLTDTTAPAHNGETTRPDEESTESLAAGSQPESIPSDAPSSSTPPPATLTPEPDTTTPPDSFTAPQSIITPSAHEADVATADDAPVDATIADELSFVVDHIDAPEPSSSIHPDDATPTGPEPATADNSAPSIPITDSPSRGSNHPTLPEADSPLYYYSESESEPESETESETASTGSADSDFPPPLPFSVDTAAANSAFAELLTPSHAPTVPDPVHILELEPAPPRDFVSDFTEVFDTTPMRLSKLVVDIIQARDLASPSSASSPSPYGVLVFQTSRGETEAVHGTNAPEWTTSFCFDVDPTRLAAAESGASDDITDSHLAITVCSRNDNGDDADAENDPLLGSVVIPLADLAGQSPRTAWYPLHGRVGSGRATGAVQLSLLWLHDLASLVTDTPGRTGPELERTFASIELNRLFVTVANATRLNFDPPANGQTTDRRLSGAGLWVTVTLQGESVTSPEGRLTSVSSPGSVAAFDWSHSFDVDADESPSDLFLELAIHRAEGRHHTLVGVARMPCQKLLDQRTRTIACEVQHPERGTHVGIVHFTVLWLHDIKTFILTARKRR